MSESKMANLLRWGDAYMLKSEVKSISPKWIGTMENGFWYVVINGEIIASKPLQEYHEAWEEASRIAQVFNET